MSKDLHPITHKIDIKHLVPVRRQRTKYGRYKFQSNHLSDVKVVGETGFGRVYLEIHG